MGPLKNSEDEYYLFGRGLSSTRNRDFSHFSLYPRDYSITKVTVTLAITSRLPGSIAMESAPASAAYALSL